MIRQEEDRGPLIDGYDYRRGEKAEGKFSFYRMHVIGKGQEKPLMEKKEDAERRRKKRGCKEETKRGERQRVNGWDKKRGQRVD